MTERISPAIARAAKAFWSELPIGIRLSGKIIVYSPILTKSIATGLAFPDLDLMTPGIGIGGHRWAVTHSALAAWLSKKGIETINRYIDQEDVRQFATEIASVAGVGFSIGLSVHLLKDALIDSEQTIRFRIPFIGGPGTILEGTYVDDDLWLGANGLYALKAAKDILLLGFGEDAKEVAAAFVKWRDQKSVIDAVNFQRQRAMEESRKLSQELSLTIPTGAEEVEWPAWLQNKNK